LIVSLDAVAILLNHFLDVVRGDLGNRKPFFSALLFLASCLWQLLLH